MNIATALARENEINKALNIAKTIKNNDAFRKWAFLNISLQAITLSINETQQKELAENIMSAFSQ